MKRITLKAINAALLAAGHREELVKGNGYFYFAGGSSSGWFSTCVYTNHLGDLTLSQWLIERKELSERAR